jgi:hypothetical protein
VIGHLLYVETHFGALVEHGLKQGDGLVGDGAPEHLVGETGLPSLDIKDGLVYFVPDEREPSREESIESVS